MSTAVALCAATWLVWAVRHNTDMQFANVPSHTPKPVYSDQFNEDMSEIRNILARKPKWNDSDVDRLRVFASRSYTFSGRVWDDSIPLSEIEAAQIQDAAIVAMGERLETKREIEVGARGKLIEILINHLGHPHWRSRLLASSVIVQAGLTDYEPRIREMIEAMKNDPDPDVAANAVGQLAHRDRVLAARVAAEQRSLSK